MGHDKSLQKSDFEKFQEVDINTQEFIFQNLMIAKKQEFKLQCVEWKLSELLHNSDNLDTGLEKSIREIIKYIDDK